MLRSLLPLLRRHINTQNLRRNSFGPVSKHFTFIPDFLRPFEQKTLLLASLEQLDKTCESRRFRKRRQEYLSQRRPQPHPPEEMISECFLPDDFYNFEEGHFDGVIKRYREMHLASWPIDDTLRPILTKIKAVCPSQETQTHLLHLASDGEILPHVDNVEASGSWILGLSLGSERILRMQDDTEILDILLPSGSLYIQSDRLRYQYKHSVLKNGDHGGQNVKGGPRLSVMIRDRLPPSATVYRT